ncbi:hypothetical protein JTB14_030286 [Gonioctena quinquepunctata]|nr:hypothetical protein JTB14_030286 [Gonioctena quinquepunctata]
MTPAVSPIGINTIKENIRGANTSVRKHKSVKELPPKVKLIESNLEESNPVSERFSKPSTGQKNYFDHSKNEDTPVRDKDFQKKNILNILLKVKQQNQQILNILIEQKQDRDAPGLKLAPPTVDLPLKTVTDVNRREAYLANEKNLAALAAYCEILGGKEKVGKINTILRCPIFNQVAAQYSFLGTRNQKRPFGTLKLRKVVIITRIKYPIVGTEPVIGSLSSLSYSLIFCAIFSLKLFNFSRCGNLVEASEQVQSAFFNYSVTVTIVDRKIERKVQGNIKGTKHEPDGRGRREVSELHFRLPKERISTQTKRQSYLSKYSWTTINVKLFSRTTSLVNVGTPVLLEDIPFWFIKLLKALQVHHPMFPKKTFENSSKKLEVTP